MRIAADGSIHVSLEERNYFRQLENLAEHNGLDRSIVTLLDAEGFDLLDIEAMLYDEEFLCEMLCN